MFRWMLPAQFGTHKQSTLREERSWFFKSHLKFWLHRCCRGAAERWFWRLRGSGMLRSPTTYDIHISCCRRPCLWMSGNCLFLVNAEEKHLVNRVGHLLAPNATYYFLLLLRSEESKDTLLQLPTPLVRGKKRNAALKGARLARSSPSCSGPSEAGATSYYCSVRDLRY